MLNLSIYAIPAFWVLSLWPHAYAMRTMRQANNQKWNNANPRGVDTNEAYKKAVPAEVYRRFERAEAAHKNCMENAPFFVGAVVIGNVAGLSPNVLTTASAAYLGLRVAYIALYIGVTRPKYSYFRTAVWALSTALLFGVLIKAGNKIAFEG